MAIWIKAKSLRRLSSHFFDTIVTVKTQEETPYGTVTCKARNPLAVKTFMNILGLPSGNIRQPLGKMTKKGLQVILDAGKKVLSDNPEIYEPLESFFGIDVEEKLNSKGLVESFCYESYI